MDSVKPQKTHEKGKLHRTADKIIDRKLEIASNIINRKLEIINGFTRRKEQSKEEIRQAAWSLFSQFGVEKVSIVDIARKAGVSQATIYNNFGSKEALVREFVIKMVDQVMEQAREFLASNKTYREKLAGFPQFVTEMMTHESHTGSETTVLHTSIDLLKDPDIKKMRDSFQEKFTDLLLDFVREGKKQGRIRSDLSEESLSVYFKFVLSITMDPELHYRFHREPKLLQDLVSLMLYGLSGQPEPVSPSRIA